MAEGMTFPTAGHVIALDGHYDDVTPGAGMVPVASLDSSPSLPVDRVSPCAPVLSAEPAPVPVVTGPQSNHAGQSYAVTIACFQRQPLLNDDCSRQWLVDAIDRARRKHDWRVWAYVIMPDHAHVLLWPAAATHDLPALLNSIKQSVRQRASVDARRNATILPMSPRVGTPTKRSRRQPFWQPSESGDHTIVTPETAFDQIDYFHRNPVRRGLCQHPEDWRWSSAADFAGLGPSPLRVDGASLFAALEMP